ncbi:MAG: ARMT1-like domain-containing protein [Desulfosalsimonadaceae bacterium]
MKTYFDCIPCFIRQALDAVRLATQDPDIQEAVLQKVLAATGSMDLKQTPPAMGQVIHRLVRELSGNHDPYQSLKTESNHYALELYPMLRETVETSAHPMETAVRLAIAGNIIDLGVSSSVSRNVIDETITRSLSEPLYGNLEFLWQAADSAETILYIGDNAGEIVFDCFLVEQLSRDKITYAVRGGPVINDATLADAEESGMARLVKVIDNGSDAPGVILEDCSDRFRQAFESADLIVAKGQGNYETLSHLEMPIVFLLKAKCPVIAGHIGCRTGTPVASRARQENAG